MFLSLGSVVLNFGILIIYCLGAFFPWRFVSSLPPLAYILFFIALLGLDEPEPNLIHRRTQEEPEDIRNTLLIRYLVYIVITLLYLVILEKARLKKSFSSKQKKSRKSRV